MKYENRMSSLAAKIEKIYDAFCDFLANFHPYVGE